MKTEKTFTAVRIVNNDEVVSFSMTEKRLRNLIKELVIGMTPTKRVLGKSPYGQGIMYQYYCEDILSYIIPNNNNEEEKMFCMYIEGYGNEKLREQIYDMINEEYIRDYNQSKMLFGIRNTKELEIRYVHLNYPKRRHVEHTKLQLQ